MRSNLPFQSNSSSKFLSRLPVLRLDDLPSLEWSWFVSHRCAETFENVTRYDKSSVDLSSTIWSLTLARGAAWLAKKRDPRLMHRPWQSKSHQASFLAYIMSLSLAVEGESSFFFREFTIFLETRKIPVFVTDYSLLAIVRCLIIGIYEDIAGSRGSTTCSPLNFQWNKETLRKLNFPFYFYIE